MFLKWHDRYFDVKKISYVGEMDYDILHHVPATINFFEIVIDGCKVRLTSKQKDELVSLRDGLIKLVELHYKT